MDYITVIDDIYNKTEPNNIRETLAKHFTPSKAEQKLNMEIHTPCVLVDDMLASIPLEFWSKPHKVLEPCCGKGNFIIAIFDLFFTGLEICIPNLELRCDKIINECIYYTDISPDNVFITTELLRRHVLSKNVTISGYNNGHIGDTLKCKINEVFSVDKFDAIICNPPYQSGNGNNGTLWNRFVIYAMDILKVSGYMLFIHPAGWRNMSGKFKKLQQLLLSKNMLCLEIHGIKDGNKMFRCATTYDWYLLQNDEVDVMNTRVRFSDGEILNIDLKKEEFIPNSQYALLKTLLATDDDNKIESLYSASLYHHSKSHMSRTKTDVMYSRSLYGIDKSHMSRTEDKIFKYPVIYTISTKNKFRFYYSSIHHDEKGHYNIPKLIWTNGSIKSVRSYLDLEGEYALTEFAYAIVDTIDNLKLIQEVFDSAKFRELMGSCAMGQAHINFRVIKEFRKDWWINFK
jgi:hypothetical protein